MDRFWSKVKIGKAEECWEWQAAKLPKGYGYFRIGTPGNWKMEQAHRVAYRLTYGSITGCVCHTCDNPSCCNPNHLFLGSRGDNNADCRAKGRNNIGVRNGNSHLTPEQVSAIRSKYRRGVYGYTRLGKEYGVTLWNIREIIKGRIWVS